MNLSINTAESRYTPHTYAIHQHLEKYSAWIDQLLGADPEERIIFESADVPLQSFFLPHFTTGIRSNIASPVVKKIEQAPRMTPRMKLTSSVQPTESALNVTWDVEWRDTPVAIWFEDCKYPAIYLPVDFVVGTSSYEMVKTLVITHKSQISVVLKKLETAFQRNSKFLEVIRGSSIKLPDDGYRWDRIVLHPETLRMVKDDFETFIKSREWFKKNDLPFRRGYLFYGSPGNGKTSVIRVMASHPLVSAFTIDMGNPDVTNNDITELFHRAANRTPALIVLEDLDRMFAKHAQEEERRKVTLQHLLNCLDGLVSPEGTIVAATANEPTDLGSALIKRPGRFDRIVEFKSPAPVQREEYYRRRTGLVLTQDQLSEIVKDAEGFTFAQLRETYIIAGQTAFAESGCDANVTISYEQLKQGVVSIRQSIKNLNKYVIKRGAGFAEDQAA